MFYDRVFAVHEVMRTNEQVDGRIEKKSCLHKEAALPSIKYKLMSKREIYSRMQRTAAPDTLCMVWLLLTKLDSTLKPDAFVAVLEFVLVLQ